MKHQHIYDLCKQHMHSYVLAETTDGKKFDGILTGLDEEYAYFAVPVEPGQFQMNPMNDYTNPYGMTDNTHNQYGQQGMYGNMPNYLHHTGHDYYGGANDSFGNTGEPYRFGYPGYGYGYGYPGYGFGYRPRRFSRLVLPLAALVALSTLPWY